MACPKGRFFACCMGITKDTGMADEQAPAAAEEEAKKPAPEGDDEGAEGEEGAAASAGGGRKKLILFGGIGFVVVLVIGAVAWFFLGGKESDGGGHGEMLAGSVYVEVPPLTTNMLADGAGEHFLKARVMVEVTSEEDKAKAEAKMPQLQDDWNAYLRQMRPEDVQGSAAVQRLKEGLLRRASQALAPIPVKQVLMTELLVQ